MTASCSYIAVAAAAASSGRRSRRRSPMQIAPHIHRLGNSSIVNSYLVEESGEVTIIDAGVPGLYRDIPRELETMGRTVADVRALVLTHGHTDHIGFAERLRREQRVPVSVHEMDAALARGEVPNPSKGFGPVRLGPLVGFLWFTILRGGLRTPKLHEVSTFGDGATLDVPGSPRVILTPGHTPGSAALSVPSLGALFVGDAFATYAVTTGARGPQVAPFTADAAEAVASLSRLEAVSSDLVLPGHGDPWTSGIQEAIRLVREDPARE
jgi:glyoxylase-like metal-dependent hydrolase (beta-lactamase superfamily II)